MTKLSKVTGNSHDVFTKHLLLNDSLDDEKTLWKSIKPFLRDYENEDNACIIIDDMLMHKLAYSNTKQSLINPYSNLTIEKSIKASAKF